MEVKVLAMARVWHVYTYSLGGWLISFGDMSEQTNFGDFNLDIAPLTPKHRAV